MALMESNYRPIRKKSISPQIYQRSSSSKPKFVKLWGVQKVQYLATLLQSSSNKKIPKKEEVLKPIKLFITSNSAKR
jgi:hypothetical protein